MRAAAVLLFIVSGAGIVAGQNVASEPKARAALRLESSPSRTANFASAFERGWRLSWQNGHLLAYRLHPGDGAALRVFRSDGTLAREARVSLPDAVDSGIEAATESSDGTLVASGWVLDAEGRVASFLGTPDARGTIQPFLRTDPFEASHMCAGPNNTIWTLGWQGLSVGSTVEAPSYPMLREFTVKGKQLRTSLNRTAVRSALPFTGRYPEEIALRCSNDYVVYFNGQSRELFVFDLSKSQLSTYVVPIFKESTTLTGFDVTNTGEIVATVEEDKVDAPAILVSLQRNGKQASWLPVSELPRTSADFRRLLGANGNDLVFMSPGRLNAGWMSLHQIPKSPK